MTVPRSPAQSLTVALAHLGPVLGHAALDAALDALTPTELAALAYDWPHMWARPNQILPAGSWRSHGFLTARRVGKTRSNSEFVNAEAASGRAMRIGFAAQNEDKTIEVMVEGDCGLIATSPPWFKARWEAGRVVWPNGAQAFPFTPEVPGSFRGPGLHLFWASEIQSWPAATREEAFQNAILMTSSGYARMVWEATPKKRHPLIRMLLERAAAFPKQHLIVRGRIDDNADNLGLGVPDELRAGMGGTQRGREELDGEYLDDDEGALWKQGWIEATRRFLPEKLKRRIISVDPAITSDPRYSDATGIMDMGLGVDDQIYAIRNLSGVHRAEVWPGMVIAAYVRGGCDLVLIETNRGGTALIALLRIAAKEVGLQIVELGKTEVPGRRPGVVYVRAINARGAKADRAAAAASYTERGHVTFVRGELGDLEDRLCSFDGSEKGPDDAIDAFVHGAIELGALTLDKRMGAAEQLDGLAERNRVLRGAPPAAPVRERSFGGGGAGQRSYDPWGTGARRGGNNGGRGML